MKIQYGFTPSMVAIAVLASTSFSSIAQNAAQNVEQDQAQLEHISVYSQKLFRDTKVVTPTSVISKEELAGINMVTAEDAIAHEPSLVVRRRYIGDSNGVIGIRGSGMFQTARSLVFADGLPLHYLLQTRWSGAPRWALIGADEVETAEVLYGPYSAEYSGNAMGGVVNLTTRTPSEQKLVLQGTLMSQQYDELGTDDNFNGHKFYVSYEDVFGRLGVMASYSLLDNDSHPQSMYFQPSDKAEQLDELGVTGYIPGKDSKNNDVIYIGDSGPESTKTELYKSKLVYSLDNHELRATLAYETRVRSTESHNYLKDAQQQSYWGLANRNFELRSHQRDSLLIGLGASGELSQNWFYDIYATDFSLDKDEERRTGLNPADPAFGSRNGRLTEYLNTGWNTLDVKVGTESLFNNDDMRLSLGVAADKYEMEIKPSNINAVTGEFVSARTESAGQTSSNSVFAQYGWAINPAWDLALGVRWEDWKTENGRYGDSIAVDRDESGTSPKLSIAYMPDEQWRIRYSVAKALRFPIAEELYRNEDATTNIVVSDPDLKPEDGLFHNLSFERVNQGGLVRVNLFREDIDDTIYYQRGTVVDGDINVSVNTFLAIDKVVTDGAELIINQKQLFDTPLSVRFNLTYTDAKIEQNSANPAIVGNALPRIPNWRANLMLSYQVNDAVDVNTSVRYASNSFGQLDNSDIYRNVFGAMDDYLFVGAKANWQIVQGVTISAGVDNIFDEQAYVYHPWPSRTFFLEGKFVFGGE